MILRDAETIVRERQKAIRREIDRRGIAMKAIAMDGGWDSTSTVLSYFPADQHAQPAVMSVASLFRLFDALPTDLLSLLLPDGYAIVQVPEGIDHDDLERGCRDFLATKGEAHHPDSPAGRDIAPCEAKALDAKVVQLRGKVRA